MTKIRERHAQMWVAWWDLGGGGGGGGGGGCTSCSNTSRAAPPIFFSLRAWVRSFWLMTGPLAVLTMMAVGFMRARERALIM
jgi:hypothetical protein